MTKVVATLVIEALAAACVHRSSLSMGMEAGRPDGSADIATDEAPLPLQCPLTVSAFNCGAPFRLGADGHVVDFSDREWSNSSGKWCDQSGLHGSVFSFRGLAQND